MPRHASLYLLKKFDFLVSYQMKNLTVVARRSDVREPERTGRKQDGRFNKGYSGNPAGRPKGSFNRTTLAAQQLLRSESEKITRKVIQLALQGDLTALRLCLDRVLPRRHPPLQIDLGPLDEVNHLRAAFAQVRVAVANGEISASELPALTALLNAHMKFFEVVEFDRRLKNLEEAAARATQTI
jgi:hypothetical protein